MPSVLFAWFHRRVGNEIGRKVSSVIAVKEPVNVEGVLRAKGGIGAEEIRQLEQAVAAEQIRELRAEANSLLNEIEEGDKSKAKTAAAGIAFYFLGDHDAAEALLGKAATADAVAAFYLGHALHALGRFIEAADTFDSARKQGHDSVQCLLFEAGAARAGLDVDRAEKLLKQASQSGATTKAGAEYCYQMGCVLADKGDTYGAVEYFERAIDMNPQHSRALFWLANENALRGNDDEAIKLYERSLSRAPMHLSALMNLGLLYEDSENYGAAAFCFRRVVEVDPTHERARLYLKDIDAAADMYYDEDSQKNQARIQQILEIPVTDFELSVRSRNCLQKMGIRNLGDLTRVTEQDLLGGKNFGETSLQEIKDMMVSKGLRLGQAMVGKERSRDLSFVHEQLDPAQQALLGRTVSDLNLSVRARKCMTRLGISSLGELVLRTPDELLESKNFGVTSLNEVRGKLGELGLKLRND
jgi:DNA-directed RNA polymerase subunit alpha